MDIEVKKQDNRLADLRRLALDVKIPVIGFDWDKRYDIKYLTSYARDKGWNLSRLTKAVDTLDLRVRLEKRRKEKKK